MQKIRKFKKGIFKRAITIGMILFNLVFIFMAVNVGHACERTSHTNGRSPLLIGGGEEFFHIFHGIVEIAKHIKL